MKLLVLFLRFNDDTAFLASSENYYEREQKDASKERVVSKSITCQSIIIKLI